MALSLSYINSLRDSDDHGDSECVFKALARSGSSIVTFTSPLGSLTGMFNGALAEAFPSPAEVVLASAFPAFPSAAEVVLASAFPAFPSPAEVVASALPSTGLIPRGTVPWTVAYLPPSGRRVTREGRTYLETETPVDLKVFARQLVEELGEEAARDLGRILQNPETA